MTRGHQATAQHLADVVAPQLREPERYVKREELAELMGVSVRTVDKLKAEGMPHETWGMRVVRFRPSVALQWVRQRDRTAT